MKRIIILCLSFALLCACRSTPEEYADNKSDGTMEDIIQEQTASSQTTPAETERRTETSTPDTSSAPASYLDALSEEDKQTVIAFAREWYAENFPNYEDLEFAFAKDSDSGYASYPQYKPGEIIILKVTSEKCFSGSRRTCFIAISDSGYEVFNEGF